MEVERYQLKNPVRIVTAASLFDGHDAAINMIRRLLQDNGCEVIHLGHNRSVMDVVQAVLQEGAQGVCVSSYQGGHMEYFKYLKDLLHMVGATEVKIFGGGGGVIIHEEKAELEAYGITYIFHPDDGRRLGLQGMINLILKACDFPAVVQPQKLQGFGSVQKKLQEPGGHLENQGQFEKERSELTSPLQQRPLGILFNAVEAVVGSSGSAPSKGAQSLASLENLNPAHYDLGSFVQGKKPLVLGLTGTGGAGKSSLIDELVQRFLNLNPQLSIAVFCVDPSKRKTGGSLLGDRIRMNSLSRRGVYMRSVASRGSGREISDSLPAMLKIARKLDFDLIIAETSGIGQGNVAITEISDVSLYVMTSDFGAQSQLEKIDMIDFADVIAVNKADRRGSLDALRDVSKQYRRSKKIFNEEVEVPVFLTQASQFNDVGVNKLFTAILEVLQKKRPEQWSGASEKAKNLLSSEEIILIPPHRQNYLSEIVETVRKYKKRTFDLEPSARKLGALKGLRDELGAKAAELESKHSKDFTHQELKDLEEFPDLVRSLSEPEYKFVVRGKEIRQPLRRTSLSGLSIPRVTLPPMEDWGTRWKFLREENVPGRFPYTSGVFPLKRTDEDPKRMFAGEGTPERTNRRFHFLCKGETAHRLSTAFDSVTLYGRDPNTRPDIYGKVGESGVSVCSLEDMKKLYAQFDLCSPNTSVSMTINGPAPMILAFFFNTAIDQQVEKAEKSKGRKLSQQEWEQVRDQTLQQVRGTVQADILKEDQGQNTCIFSINFALKMMGDIQEYFVKKSIRNFYSVSISGYHIAEAGANPISQLAFTLSNGFTFVEYYLARGMSVDDFAPNLSFFFSNGLDPEYTVLGRVARRIWSVVMRDRYGADERSQKLKYHIQTSGRSLHAQEIAFNDIRTTLQALIALNDNCNSLHTNAYDEAITTPTEESVRRAMAIQMIINREFGWMMNENSMQGSYFFNYMTDLVEEAVLSEFQRISERGGVLGAMETQYQRSKIQEESMLYEHLKHSGQLPIIGVNTFVDPKTLAEGYVPPRIELARASQEEKQEQLRNLEIVRRAGEDRRQQSLEKLKSSVLRGENIFEALMESSRICSLEDMTQALFEVGGQYRRNI